MKRVVVMGLGVTGRAVASALLRRGIEVIALDDRIDDDLLAWAGQADLSVCSSDDAGLGQMLAGADALVPAPGLPDHHPIFAAAATANVDVLSEFDLAAQWDDRPAIAVTGTDGKTTVVTLVQRMLDESGIKAMAVGNTDTPWVEAIDDPTIDVFVVEASSFRLGHSRRFSPQVGTWLNFGPDHLDAHSDLATYEQAKASMWDHLEPGAVAVANRDDAVVARYASALGEAQVQTFGAGAPIVTTDHGIVDDVLVVAGKPLISIDELSRSMPHDVQNGLAAAASALAIGADRNAIATVLRDFTGLPHRVELVGELNGVRYVNDSKATTPHAAAAALGGFESIVLLAGGKNKGLAFDDMLDHIDRIRHVVAIGDSAGEIEAVFAPHAPTSIATSMRAAIEQATDIAEAGDAVLLSPACASFDWYRSYVHRGEDFTQIVRSLIAASTDGKI